LIKTDDQVKHYDCIIQIPSCAYLKIATVYVFHQSKIAFLLSNEQFTRSLVSLQKCLWGVKYTIKGARKVAQVLEKLSVRETVLGSYITITAKFYGKNSNNICDVLVYLATEKNPLYVGPSSEDDEKDLQCLSDTIVHARGSAGSNSEYVTKLADYIRLHIPEEMDQHLFILDKMVRNKMTLLHEHRHQG
jgi:cation transport regulator ChaC